MSTESQSDVVRLVGKVDWHFGEMVSSRTVDEHHHPRSSFKTAGASEAPAELLRPSLTGQLWAHVSRHSDLGYWATALMFVGGAKLLLTDAA